MGKKYVIKPVSKDEFNGTETPLWATNGFWDADLIYTDPDLYANIDSYTGNVTVRFDELPAESKSYKFVVRVTYEDGSFEDVESQFVATVASNNSGSTETPAPSPSVSSDAAVPAPDTSSTPTVDSSNPTESAVASPTDSAEAATDEPTTAEQPTDAVTEAVTEANTGSPAGVDSTEAETQLAQSSLHTANSETANQATNEQSAVLASTGTKNAVLVFLAGLVALGAGTALVVGRKHS